MSLRSTFSLRNPILGPISASLRQTPFGVSRPSIMVGQEGLEPPTTGLEIRCSIQLSYCPTGHAFT